MNSQAFERLFAIFLFLLSMQVWIGLTRPSESEIDPASVSAPVHVLDTAIDMGLDVYGALLILLRWRRVLQAIRAARPLVSLAVLAALSTAWSDHPMLTLRRSALLLLSTLFAIYLGERYSIEEQAQLLARIFCGMIVAICIFYLVAPAYVIDYVSHPGDWKGLSAYKNAFGQYMGIAVLLLLLVRFRRLDWLRYGFLAAAVGLLYLSRSAASLFCTVLIVAAMPLWRVVRVTKSQRPAVYTAVGIMLSTGMYLLATHTDRVFYMLGRNSSLTGRTQLWGAAWDAIMKRPVLGYGFDSFWASLQGEALNVRIGAGWLAQRSDNGYLDLGLALGIVGIILFLFVFALSFSKSIDWLKSKPQAIGLWPISYLCFFLLHNISESTLLTRGDFPSLLFAMVFTSLALSRSHETNQGNISERLNTECELAQYAL
jgi:exopolysaccharide production protein ExoQ